MDGLSIGMYATQASQKTSMELFHLLRDLVRADEGSRINPAAAINPVSFEDLEYPAFEDAMNTVMRATLLVGMLETRGVLADVEQYLTGLYEITRRPGYAGTATPLERAARDAADGVQP